MHLMRFLRLRSAKFAAPLRVAGFTVFLLTVAVPAFAEEEAKSPGFFGTLAYWIAGLISWIGQIIAQLIVALIESGVLPLVLYNDFANSPVVRAGWTITRDSVNIFFVIVLIVIAVGTIFGHERFQWQRQVPRLLLMAVVINFSKTIASLMIDASQIITLTFANALKDIAGGNFIELLGLSVAFQQNIEKAGIVPENVTPKGAFEYLGASLGTLFLLIFVLAVMLALV